MSQQPQLGPDVRCPDCDGGGYVADTDASVTGKLGSLQYVPAKAGGVVLSTGPECPPLSAPLSYVDGVGRRRGAG